MKEILDYLEQLGVSETEARLYLKLLETGNISVRQLAKILGINRTSAYLHIDQLIEKGLVMKLVKGSKKLVAANAPEDSLKDLLEKKAQIVQTIQSEFPKIIREIKTSVPKNKPVGEAEIKYYKGNSGVRKIYYEALKAKELCSYAKVQETAGAFPDNIELFTNAFKENPALIIREILYDSPLVKQQAPKLLSKSKRYSYKLMPSDLKLSSEDILIYDNKVAIINYKGKVNSVILHSIDFYNNSKELFEFIWNLIP